MTGPTKSDIGFGKKIRAAWLDLSLEHVAAGHTFSDAKDELIELVRIDNSGSEAIRKVLSCLKRVWFEPPNYCRATRDAGIEIYKRSNASNTRFLLHWGMTISSYPFVGSVAEAIGRLIKLQGTARISDINRRIQEKCGDREFVRRIVRYDISSFLEWGALSETKTNGEYATGSLVHLTEPDDVAWLTEALLHTRNDASLPLAQLRQHPIFFPFQLGVVGIGYSKGNPRLQTFRHGQTEDLVMLLEK